MAPTQADQILELAHRQRLLKAADVRARGWSPQLLLKLHQAGKLQRAARGLYSLPDAQPTEHQTLIEVCHRVPKAVVCLLSALQFHGIGTQLPHEPMPGERAGSAWTRSLISRGSIASRR